MTIEQRVQKIEQRNKNVEGDKAWEMSLLRRGFIVIVTYCTVTCFLWFIGIQDFYLAALVPTGGYIFSTLSLSPLKRIWKKLN